MHMCRTLHVPFNRRDVLGKTRWHSDQAIPTSIQPVQSVTELVHSHAFAPIAQSFRLRTAGLERVLVQCNALHTCITSILS